MAKVTIVFEDVEEGINIVIESDPPFPAATQEEQDSLTEAQHMALRMTHLISSEVDENEDHVHDENCHDQKCPYLNAEQNS